MKIATLLSATVLGSSLAIAASLAPAQAFTFSFDGTSQSSNTPATGASAKVDFTFANVANGIQMTLGITNTTGQIPAFGAGATTSKLTGIAFDLLPNLSIVPNSFTGDSHFTTLLTNVEFAPFSNSAGYGAVGNFSVGIADNNNFEGGNANGALPQGSTSTVSLVLTGYASGTTASDLETAFFNAFTHPNEGVNIAARFQQVGGGAGYRGAGSEKLLGGTGDNDGDNGGGGDVSVPEPGTVFGLGVVASIFAARRRKAVANS